MVSPALLARNGNQEWHWDPDTPRASSAHFPSPPGMRSHSQWQWTQWGEEESWGARLARSLMAIILGALVIPDLSGEGGTILNASVTNALFCVVLALTLSKSEAWTE